ncbi:family 10 glycosylhydrolase [Membranihabitans marinus]|uniref:family 10 glycosylhydrolase n=1 Tax=Membranihabitans marinus TaxID=1227546 RepID=UPI001F3DF313|nr:family 10 glycosylhydrolase [Membranihabitans marinus]
MRYVDLLLVWRNYIAMYGLFGLTCLMSCTSADKNNRSTISDIEAYREQRDEKLNQPRPLIHNNDGCDVIYFPTKELYTAENYLDKRTDGLIGTDVTTISFCPTASGFGNFTYNTKVGEVFSKNGFDYGIHEDSRNLTAEMIAKGTDPLEINSNFADLHDFEFFFSNRMNDTHDASHRKDKPYLLWTEFKENNPEYLFGKIGERLPNGRWSSLNFDHKEVRDLCVQFFKEVCDNYPVDGVELDFLRHFELFESVGRGGVASQKQLDLLTEMVREIRTVTEEAGMKRGRPILVLIRVPTSAEYAKKAGADYQRWIDEELVDIVVGSCYFRLEYWEDFARLGDDKKVKIYAGLSESRVLDEHPLLKRQQNAVFRARAAAAWEAGIDGIYSFNEYNTRVKYLSQIGTPSKLQNTNNLYFVTYRDYTADRYLKGGNDFFKLPILSPSKGKYKDLNQQKMELNIELGDESTQSVTYAIVYTENADPNKLEIAINGNSIEFVKSSTDGISLYKVNQADLKAGKNNIELQYTGAANRDAKIRDLALFFCRDTEDLEMRSLIQFCQGD